MQTRRRVEVEVQLLGSFAARAHAVEAHGHRLGAGNTAAGLTVAGAVAIGPTRERAHHLLGVAFRVAGSTNCIPGPPRQGSPRSVPCRRR